MRIFIRKMHANSNRCSKIFQVLADTDKNYNKLFGIEFSISLNRLYHLLGNHQHVFNNLLDFFIWQKFVRAYDTHLS